MQKYKVTFQKILDGYVEVYATDPAEAKDEASYLVSDETFVVEYETWDSHVTTVEEIDENPNADLWS